MNCDCSMCTAEKYRRSLLHQSASREPEDVQAARALIARWEKRHGHDSYVEVALVAAVERFASCVAARLCRGQCWDCDWEGPEHMRGGEPMGTVESRGIEHQRVTTPADWRAT